MWCNEHLEIIVSLLIKLKLDYSKMLLLLLLLLLLKQVLECSKRVRDKHTLRTATHCS